MDKNYKQMTQFLVDMGIEKIPHTHKTYLGHLIAVHRLMESEGCKEDACRAGMFHSVYGTERSRASSCPWSDEATYGPHSANERERNSP